jgi:hypothetical protein
VRISDRRYARDLRRYQLAWRMIRQDVRNSAVARWTELSMYRIKTLYEAYAGGGHSPPRGSAPYQVAHFWSSLQSRTEASILAGFLVAYEVLPEPGVPMERLETVSRGERLCRAYEEFLAVWPEAQLRLEHAMLLLGELVRGIEMELTECSGCDVLVVADRMALGPPRCAFCLHELQAGRRYDRRVSSRPKVASPEEWSPGTQGRLF